MTKQEILETYGRSIFQIRLEVAIAIFARTHDEEQALQLADIFVATLLDENLELKA
jgi:hypothetical protein